MMHITGCVPSEVSMIMYYQELMSRPISGAYEPELMSLRAAHKLLVLYTESLSILCGMLVQFNQHSNCVYIN